MSALVLIVEDEPILGRNMRTFLNSRGYRCELAPTLAAAQRGWSELHPDLILLDHNLPDGIGLTLVTQIREKDPWTKIVMITAHGGVSLAVAAMKAGADDYMTKPISLEELGLLASRMMEQARRDSAARFLNRRAVEDSSLERILGTSSAIADVRRRVRALTSADAGVTAGPSVLVMGETGTGKELVARALHFGGPRAAEPFIALNCAALPDATIDAELFGVERGAFEGATEKRIGLFEAAHGGTLFLDEVGALAPLHQAKLLKALEDGRIRPVGSAMDRRVDVRVIAATNAPLAEMVADGRFRSDLYYRLANVTLTLPPLRQRGHDAIQIAESLIADQQKRLSRPKLYLTQAAQAVLLRHAWPGNIRELGNVIAQACLLSPRDAIEAADLNLRDTAPAPEPEAGEASLSDVERTLIVTALRQHGGNVTLAAQSLGISRDTLRYRMEKYALKRDYYTS